MDQRVAFGLIAVGLTGMVVIFNATQWLGSHGLRILHSSCAWDPGLQQYLASVAVRNDDDVFKLVQLNVQGRFHPPAGARWPRQSLRTKYEAVTKPLELVIEPRETVSGSREFAIPGAEGFECAAHVQIAGQDRFTEPPSDELMEAVWERERAREEDGRL